MNSVKDGVLGKRQRRRKYLPPRNLPLQVQYAAQKLGTQTRPQGAGNSAAQNMGIYDSSTGTSEFGKYATGFLSQNLFGGVQKGIAKEIEKLKEKLEELTTQLRNELNVSNGMQANIIREEMRSVNHRLRQLGRGYSSANNSYRDYHSARDGSHAETSVRHLSYDPDHLRVSSDGTVHAEESKNISEANTTQKREHRVSSRHGRGIIRRRVIEEEERKSEDSNNNGLSEERDRMNDSMTSVVDQHVRSQANQQYERRMQALFEKVNSALSRNSSAALNQSWRASQQQRESSYRRQEGLDIVNRSIAMRDAQPRLWQSQSYPRQARMSNHSRLEDTISDEEFQSILRGSIAPPRYVIEGPSNVPENLNPHSVLQPNAAIFERARSLLGSAHSSANGGGSAGQVHAIPANNRSANSSITGSVNSGLGSGAPVPLVFDHERVYPRNPNEVLQQQQQHAVPSSRRSSNNSGGSIHSYHSSGGATEVRRMNSSSHPSTQINPVSIFDSSGLSR